MTLTPPVYTELQGLSELRLAAKQNQPQALRKVAQQFEALFLQMMLKGMRDAELGQGMFDSDQSRLYQEMYDKQISLSLAQGGSLGLAEIMIRQLGGTPEQTDESVKQPLNLLHMLQTRRQSHMSDVASKRRVAASPADFVDKMWPHAERAAQRLGVEPRILVAQAALETGWGKHVMHRADGSSSHNIFGIKTGSSWDGARVTVPTMEYQNGVALRKRDSFRAYGSYAEAFEDYANLLQRLPRYQAALDNSADPEGFVRGLQQGGFATDPVYADKIVSIYHGTTLAEAMVAFKNPLVRSLT